MKPGYSRDLVETSAIVGGVDDVTLPDAGDDGRDEEDGGVEVGQLVLQQQEADVLDEDFPHFVQRPEEDSLDPVDQRLFEDERRELLRLLPLQRRDVFPIAAADAADAAAYYSGAGVGRIFRVARHDWIMIRGKSACVISSAFPGNY